MEPVELVRHATLAGNRSGAVVGTSWLYAKLIAGENASIARIYLFFIVKRTSGVRLRRLAADSLDPLVGHFI